MHLQGGQIWFVFWGSTRHTQGVGSYMRVKRAFYSYQTMVLAFEVQIYSSVERKNVCFCESTVANSNILGGYSRKHKN